MTSTSRSMILPVDDRLPLRGRRPPRKSESTATENTHRKARRMTDGRETLGMRRAGGVGW